MTQNWPIVTGFCGLERNRAVNWSTFLTHRATTANYLRAIYIFAANIK